MFDRTTAAQKTLGDYELVYATITKIEMVKGIKHITWDHVTGKPGNPHEVSADKLEYDNCYSQLEVGKTYIIIQLLIKNKPYGRWVWVSAKEVTPKAAKFVSGKMGFRFGNIADSDEEQDEAMKKLKEAYLIAVPTKPRKTINLDHLLEF